jgi:hypothetical protein
VKGKIKSSIFNHQENFSLRWWGEGRGEGKDMHKKRSWTLTLSSTSSTRLQLEEAVLNGLFP